MAHDLDTEAAELHTRLVALKIGESYEDWNCTITRTGKDTYEYAKNGRKCSGSATGVASLLTLTRPRYYYPPGTRVSGGDAVSRKRILAFCESLKNGILEKKRKNNADYASLGTCSVIAEFVETLLPFEPK
jgi:hypothetical protein